MSFDHTGFVAPGGLFRRKVTAWEALDELTHGFLIALHKEHGPFRFSQLHPSGLHRVVKVCRKATRKLGMTGERDGQALWANLQARQLAGFRPLLVVRARDGLIHIYKDPRHE